MCRFFRGDSRYLLASTPGREYTYSQIYQLVWQEHPHGDITNIISVKSLWQKYVEASFIFEWIPILEYKKINYGIDLP